MTRDKFQLYEEREPPGDPRERQERQPDWGAVDIREKVEQGFPDALPHELEYEIRVRAMVLDALRAPRATKHRRAA